MSRQGEWLVFTEKYGLLTTQNGTQQVNVNSCINMHLRVSAEKFMKVRSIKYYIANNNFRKLKTELNLTTEIIKNYLSWDIEDLNEQTR